MKQGQPYFALAISFQSELTAKGYLANGYSQTYPKVTPIELTLMSNSHFEMVAGEERKLERNQKPRSSIDISILNLPINLNAHQLFPRKYKAIDRYAIDVQPRGCRG